MKKLLATLTFVLGVVVLSFAQEATNTAATEGADALKKSKTSGTYQYVLPQGTTTAEVDQAASYYTDYFTVDYDNATQEASIVITGDVVQSRQIMMRFLSGCGVAYVEVDGENHELIPFHTEFVK